MWLSRCFATGGGGGALAGAAGCARRHVAIDDILPLADRGAARRRDQVFDRDETQHAGAAGLHRHVGNARGPLRLIADPQRLEKFQFAAGPHPARQRHRRQEAAAGGMAVLAQFRHRKHRLRQAPMHGPRRRVARLRLADLLEQRGAQALHQLRGDDVGGLGAAADPLPQMIEIEFRLFGHDDLVRTRGVLGSRLWSPMPGTAP